MDDRSFLNVGGGRRKSLRRHFGYPGQMHFGGDAPPRACIIIDMSESGAQLQVAAKLEVPPEFSLLIGGKADVRRHCYIVWRSGNRMGVQFRIAKGTSRGATEAAARPKQRA